MNELYLGIDTATPYLAMALWSPQRGNVASTVELVERRHAARLIGALEEIVARAGVPRSALTAIAAGAGPGSYTGLRVGAAAAMGLARALAVPLFGCDTLAAIAFAALQEGEEGLAALDARRGNVYVGRYRRQGEELLTLSGPGKASRDGVIEQYPGLRLIEDTPPDPAYVASAAARRLPYKPLYL